MPLIIQLGNNKRKEEHLEAAISLTKLFNGFEIWLQYTKKEHKVEGLWKNAMRLGVHL